MSRWLGLYLRGMAMGAADVVPGVSGGTIALVVGVYEELIRTLSGLSPALLRVWREQGFAAAWRAGNLGFLVSLLAGILSAIVLLAQLVSHLIVAHPVPLWSFFLGLIVASIFVLLRPIPWDRMRNWLLFVAGVLVGFGVISLPRVSGIEPTPWIYFLSGAVAICAMILPGISGSFILVILGMYAPVLAAVKDFNLWIIFCFAAGCATGLLSFVHLLRWLLARWHDPIMCLLVGFMGGTLVVLWPWQVPQGANVVYVLPAQYSALTGLSAQWPLALLAAAVGVAAVLLLNRFAGVRGDGSERS